MGKGGSGLLIPSSQDLSDQIDVWYTTSRVIQNENLPDIEKCWDSVAIQPLPPPVVQYGLQMQVFGS